MHNYIYIYYSCIYVPIPCKCSLQDVQRCSICHGAYPDLMALQLPLHVDAAGSFLPHVHSVLYLQPKKKSVNASIGTDASKQ